MKLTTVRGQYLKLILEQTATTSILPLTANTTPPLFNSIVGKNITNFINNWNQLIGGDFL